MEIPFTGGCLCGAVRYECSAKPISAAICHCRNCQQATGTAFAAGMLVPKNAVTIAGNVTYYDVVGDSGNIVGRGFCPICGSRLFSQPPMPDLMGIMAGSMDDPQGFEPQAEIYAASAQPWAHLNSELPKFAKLPPPRR